MIDPKIQAELRERFNPDGSMLRQHQLRMLEMLKYIDKVCQENNIPYWLSSGTCLGAVRHGGFIPWDDDMDIEMLGRDYDRFIKIIETTNDCPYVLQTHKSDPSYIISFGKLRDRFSEIVEDDIMDKDYKYKGIYIDIFPIEPSNSLKLALLGKYLYLICWIMNKLTNKMVRKTCRTIVYIGVFKVIIPILKPFTKMSNKKILRHRLGSTYIKKRNYDHIFPLNQIQFEGYSFTCPYDTDAYLKLIYGDYMKLPSKIEIHASNIRFIE